MINDVESCREVEKTKTGYFLRSNSIDELIVNIEKNSFDGMMLTVRRLVRLEKVVRKRYLFIVHLSLHVARPKQDFLHTYNMSFPFPRYCSHFHYHSH